MSAPSEQKKKRKKKKKFRLDRNDFGFICAGVSNMGGHERNASYNLSCLLQPYFCLIANEKLSVSLQLFQTYGVISYGSVWRKDAVNKCLECGLRQHSTGTGWNRLRLELTGLDAKLPHGGVAQDLGDFVVDVATQQEGRQVVVVGTRTDSVHQAGACPVPVLIDVANLCAATESRA